MQKMAAAALFLSLSFVGGGDLLAQRSGFIIGLGVGPGVTSSDLNLADLSTTETAVGLATDLKIGAQVSPSLQVYYLGRTNWANGVAAGISAVGATYVLPSAPVQLSGGIGLASWIEICIESCTNGSFAGLGVSGGVGWEFADLWLLDVAVTYGSLNDSVGNVDMFLARAGISILSH